MLVPVDLSFSNGIVVKSSQEPYFLSDNGIKGCITIDERCQTKFDLVKISLEGVLLNSIRYTDWPHGQQGDARKLQVLLRMADVKKNSEFARQTHAGRMQARCSFQFHVPRCLGRNLLGEDFEYLSDLPASLSCAEAERYGSNTFKSSWGQSRIFYSIRADVIRRETVIGTIIKFVHIIPTLQARPPLCISDFGSEYTVQSTKAMKSRSRIPGSRVGSCTIEVAEPETVALRRPCDPVSIDLPLKIVVQPSTPSNSTFGRRTDRETAQFQEQLETIINANCSCSSALIASTYISMLPRREVPTNSEVNKDSMVARNLVTCSTATTNLDLTGHWIHDQESRCWQKTTRLRLTFKDFRELKPLVPSFDSSMISHRFKIALTLQLCEPYRMTFNLDVPITVRYCGDIDDQPPSFDQIYPMLDANADTTAPIALTTSLEQQLSAVNIQDLLNGQYEQHENRQDINLPEYHPRRLAVDAPPYVI